MTTQEIKARIAAIKEMKGDFEIAHSSEDRLRADFIKYVASLPGNPSLSAKAQLVLSTSKIEFARYCA